MQRGLDYRGFFSIKDQRKNGEKEGVRKYEQHHIRVAYGSRVFADPSGRDIKSGGNDSIDKRSGEKNVFDEFFEFFHI